MKKAAEQNKHTLLSILASHPGEVFPLETLRGQIAETRECTRGLLARLRADGDVVNATHVTARHWFGTSLRTYMVAGWKIRPEVMR